jgi:glycosyltransferase involved in cell wall biosynthesis
MRVALVHDYLNQWGGAERVLEVLAQIFPEADIYTLFHDPAATRGKFSGRVAKTSFLDQPFIHKNHRWFIPLMPMAAEVLRIPDKYDLIISATAGFAKGVSAPRGAKHLSYCHTPLRYAWEPDYIKSKYQFLSSKFSSSFLKIILSYLRSWDLEASRKPDMTIANSGFIAEKIKRYYGLSASVLYPPVDTAFWSYDPKTKRGDYFLAVGRFLHYKKFDLIIKAFNKLQMPLKIAGNGPEEKFLMSLAADFPIEFVGNPADAELRGLYRGARALIFPQVEDFGMVAAEALACGAPVVAYAEGGALEIVEDGETGVLFYEQTPEALAAAIKLAEQKRWKRNAIAASAERFSLDRFQQGIMEAVSRLASS